MTHYRPDIYGETPAQALWPVFHFIAKRWALTADEKAGVLGEEVEPIGSPPPTGSARAHIELVKDCYLHITSAQISTADKDGGLWIRRPVIPFNNLSALDVMTRTPEYLRRHTRPLYPQQSDLWTDPDGPRPTMGLELVRGLFAFNKPAAENPRQRLHELVSVAIYKPR
jgi:hypothetical protein